MKPMHLLIFKWHTGIPNGDEEYNCFVDWISEKKTEEEIKQIIEKQLMTYVNGYDTFEKVTKFMSLGEGYYLTAKLQNINISYNIEVEIKPVLVVENEVFELHSIGKINRGIKKI